MNNTWTPYAYANISGAYDALAYGNTVTSGAFGAGLMLGIWVVMFVVLRQGGRDEAAFAAASFIGALMAALLRGTSQLSDPLMVLFIMMTLGGAFLLWRDR